jgi:hypothetical protein
LNIDALPLKYRKYILAGLRLHMGQRSRTGSPQSERPQEGNMSYTAIRDSEPGPRCVEGNARIGHLGAQPADCYTRSVVKAQKDAMLARQG